MNALKLSRISIAMFGLGLGLARDSGATLPGPGGNKSRPLRRSSVLILHSPSCNSYPTTRRQPKRRRCECEHLRSSAAGSKYEANRFERTSSGVSHGHSAPCHRFVSKREGQIGSAGGSRSQLGITDSPRPNAVTGQIGSRPLIIGEPIRIGFSH
jgi:hypothetical protein